MSNLNQSSQATSNMFSEPYEKSVCGSIINPIATNLSSEIFSYLRHGHLEAFRRSIGMHQKDILAMRNEHGQSVLHVVTIAVFHYPWIRFLLMNGCDPRCQDNERYTAAHYAVERDDIHMLRALTVRICQEVRPIPEQQLRATHEYCLEALSLREKHGLTVFMLACQHQSMRCLNYLIEINVNDASLQDNHGDTCLHYAVAHRNVTLVDKLVNQCHADVNGGDNARPSVLDMLQFNRERQETFNRTNDDLIEQILLTNHAQNRCGLGSFLNKRKRTLDNDETVISDLACLTVESMTTRTRIDTARNYARIAFSYEKSGDINNAYDYYKRAMDSVPSDVLDWADYAWHVAVLETIRGEDESALSLLQQALILRKKFENISEETIKIQSAIENLGTRMKISVSNVQNQ